MRHVQPVGKTEACILTGKALTAKARKIGIVGRSTMKAQELRDAIAAHETHLATTRKTTVVDIAELDSMVVHDALPAHLVGDVAGSHYVKAASTERGGYARTAVGGVNGTHFRQSALNPKIIDMIDTVRVEPTQSMLTTRQIELSQELPPNWKAWVAAEQAARGSDRPRRRAQSNDTIMSIESTTALMLALCLIALGFLLGVTL